jgi:HEPN domain-containing protein
MSALLDPTDPREWMRRARSNLVHARSRAEGVCFEDLCFDAQQAAEKAIKAVLVSVRARFPYVHDIQVLLGVLAAEGIPIPDRVMESVKLTPFAVGARYPSVSKEVTEQQYLDALDIASDVVAWADAQIGPPTE